MHAGALAGTPAWSACSLAGCGPALRRRPPSRLRPQRTPPRTPALPVSDLTPAQTLGILTGPRGPRGALELGYKHPVFSAKTDAPVQLRTRCESAMRGLRCGAHIGGGRCLFSTQRFAPCFLTFVRRVTRVHSQTFEGGIDSPRFLVSKLIVGSQFGGVMPVCGAGARYKLV